MNSESERIAKEIRSSAQEFAREILRQPMGGYTLSEIDGPFRGVFDKELIRALLLQSGRNNEAILPVVMSLAGDFNRLPVRLTCRLYRSLYYAESLRSRLPDKFILHFSGIYERLTSTMTTVIIDRDADVYEREFGADHKRSHQSGASAGYGAGGASAKISYTYDRSFTNLMREKRRKESVSETQTQRTQMPLQDSDAVDVLNDLINELAGYPLGLYYNHLAVNLEIFGAVIKREDWLKKFLAKLKQGCLMSLFDVVIILPRLLFQTTFNVVQFAAKYAPFLKRALGQKSIRPLFILHGYDLSSPFAKLVEAQLEDLVSNPNAVFVIFTRNS